MSCSPGTIKTLSLTYIYVASNQQLVIGDDWDSLFASDINVSLQNWQDQFLYIMEECIPRASSSSRRRLPWFSKRIMGLIKTKNSLFKAWKKQGTPALHKRYKSARNRLTKMLKSAKQNFFRNLNTVDQKLFWKTFHLLTSNSSSIPVLVHDCGKASTSQEKADILSEFFKKCFNSSILPLTFADFDTFGTESNSCPDDFLCSIEEMQHLLETLDVSI